MCAVDNLIHLKNNLFEILFDSDFYYKFTEFSSPEINKWIKLSVMIENSKLIISLGIIRHMNFSFYLRWRRYKSFNFKQGSI